jgi:two-component system, chemotaxis family, sensor kinase CheA
MSELQEATKEFLIESHENLDQLDVDLVALERAPDQRERLARIFRTLHTIKGSCSFLGFPKLEALAHAGENLLGRLREGQLALSPAVTNLLLGMVDAVRRMLATIESTGSDGDDDHRKLIDALTHAESDATTSAVLAPRLSAERRLPAEADGDGEAPSGVYDASVRLDVGLLDKLMTVASEIVLARNQILQYAARHPDPAFQNVCRQLSLTTSELQEHVMKTRLQPIGNVWHRFPRLVRDATLACGKEVRLETEGSETELDKALLDAIRDPLTHLVRNAVDHGIETPEARRSAGKPPEGRLRLRAYHEGGQVNVEVADDGAGIDPERIKRRALEQRLVSAEQVSRMSDQTLLGLIFLPGFSTAPAATHLSGRGVGMDVVKSNVEKVGGSVDVQSTPGRGTAVRIRIPLTLAIVKVLLVDCAGERYAIPQVSIVELIRLEGEKLRKGVQRVGGARVYSYRGRLLPLVDLRQALQVPAAPGEEEALNLVVLQAADRRLGLVVDAISDTQEIVVKPLWKRLKGLCCFAGATIMGDGKVALILDVFGLARRANVLQEVREAEEKPTAPPADRHTVLLVEGPNRGRMAIPLDCVARLEEFPASQVERVGDDFVVQYRGGILPLVDLEKAGGAGGGERLTRGRERIPVVVYARGGESVGLVVERIVDIVEEPLAVKGRPTRDGVSCTAVIAGQVAEVLDVDRLIAAGGAGKAGS